MFTLFASPKKFCGHFDIIQRNAIQSWMRLYPSCDILLFGSDEGTAAIAAEFRIRHIPDVALSDYGTPLLSDMFAQAEQLAKYSILCYVNADIILLSDFSRAVAQAAQCCPRFLLVGQRWDVDLKNELDFSASWEKDLRSYIRQAGMLHDIVGIDYFVFTRGLFGTLPSFAIGRAGWDNWMIYQARSRGITVVDATPTVMAVHQNHDYSHLPKGRFTAYDGQEAMQNRQLAGIESYFNIYDATYRLTKLGLEPNLDKECLWQRLNRQTALNRFRGTSTIRYLLLRSLIWMWKLFLVCVPFKAGRRLVYHWLAWSEKQPTIALATISKG